MISLCFACLLYHCLWLLCNTDRDSVTKSSGKHDLRCCHETGPNEHCLILSRNWTETRLGLYLVQIVPSNDISIRFWWCSYHLQVQCSCLWKKNIMGCTHFPCQVRPGTHVVLVIVFLELEGKCLFWFPVRTDKSSWESRESKIRGDFMFLMIFWWLKTNCWEDWYETMFIDWKKLSSWICHKCRDISLPFCKEHWNSSPSHSHVVRLQHESWIQKHDDDGCCFWFLCKHKNTFFSFLSCLKFKIFFVVTENRS